jgi:O-antigen/teichoic acid export membrane protein
MIKTLSFRVSLGALSTPIAVLVDQLRDEETRGPMLFILSSGIKSTTQMISALIVARLVLPEFLGTWNSISILESYLLVLSLGIPNALTREYALYRGKNDSEHALRTGWVGLTSSLIWASISLIVVLAVLLYSWLTHAEQQTIVALALFTLPVSLDPIISCLNDLYRGGEEFMQLGKIQLCETVWLVASIAIVAAGGWVGLFARYASVSLVGIVLRYVWRPIPWRLAWDWTIFKRLVQLGVKMLYETYIWGLVFVADRTLIAAMLGKTEVGYYALALSAQTAIVIMPISLRQVIYARMSFRYGQTAQANSLWRVTFLPVLFNAVFLIVPVAVLYVLVDPFIHAFLPEYVPGIRAAQLMLISGYFLCLQTSRSIFPTLNRMFAYNVLTSAMLILMWVLGYILISIFESIESVALTMVIVMAVYAIGVNLLAYRTIKSVSRSEIITVGVPA